MGNSNALFQDGSDDLEFAAEVRAVRQSEIEHRLEPSSSSAPRPLPHWVVMRADRIGLRRRRSLGELLGRLRKHLTGGVELYPLVGQRGPRAG